MIIIDRFEGEFAVLETDNSIINVARSVLPDNAAEGDVLSFEDGVYTVDHEITESRRASAAARLNRLRRVDND